MKKEFKKYVESTKNWRWHVPAKENFGEYIKFCRNRHKIPKLTGYTYTTYCNQIEFCRHYEIKVRSLQNWESNSTKPNFADGLKLIKILNLDTEYVLELLTKAD